jgi:hypothetical protein
MPMRPAAVEGPGIGRRRHGRKRLMAVWRLAGAFRRSTLSRVPCNAFFLLETLERGGARGHRHLRNVSPFRRRQSRRAGRIGLHLQGKGNPKPLFQLFVEINQE